MFVHHAHEVFAGIALGDWGREITQGIQADQRRLQEDFAPEAETVQLAENTGFASANNHTVERVDTHFVALLNSDAWPAI